MRIPDDILRAVGFLAKASRPTQYLGTGFLVGVRRKQKAVSEGVDLSTGDPRTYTRLECDQMSWEDFSKAFKGHPPRDILHLVTAKHVQVGLDGEDFIFATNGVDGRKLDLTLPGNVWIQHPTEADSVDVAVAFFTPMEPVMHPSQHILESIFATDERMSQFQIGLGDEIFTVGLFSAFSGSTQRTPIVRTGNLAMMPLDKILVPNFGYIEAYLAEGRSIGGLSGSPVFVRGTIVMTQVRSDGQKRNMLAHGNFHLLGLMQGHYDVLEGDIGPQHRKPVNMGVAIIVPAKKILEVLYHPVLVEFRSLFDEMSNFEQVEMRNR